MSAPMRVMPQPDGADLFEALATSPDPWVRLVAAADDLRGMVPGADEALAADGPYGRLRRLLVDLAQDLDPWVRMAACKSLVLPEEIAEAVAGLGGPGRLRAHWVDTVSQLPDTWDDAALRMAVAAPPREPDEPDDDEPDDDEPQYWQIWGALANAKDETVRLISLQVPALASAATERYGPEAIVDQVAELAVDPDAQVRELARALPPRWPR